jgi:hypothetical protein
MISKRLGFKIKKSSFRLNGILFSRYFPIEMQSCKFSLMFNQTNSQLTESKVSLEKYNISHKFFHRFYYINVFLNLFLAMLLYF